MSSTLFDFMTRNELLQELESLLAERASHRQGDAGSLAHELRVHELELEMQNRELREVQQHLEASRDRYANLYDFAPVAYCTLDRSGFIREANLTTAALVGRKRETLTGQPLARIVGADMEAITHHLRRCNDLTQQTSTDLTCQPSGRPPLELQLVSTPVRMAGGETWFRTALLDVTEVRELERRLRFLSEVGETLGRAFDRDGAFGCVARLAVPLLADLCILDVLDADGASHRPEVAFAASDKQARLAGPLTRFVPRKEWQTPEAQALRHGRPVLVSHLGRERLTVIAHDDQHAELLTQIGVRSIMCVPLIARDHVLGVLTLVTAESGRDFGPKDLTFAEDFAGRIAVAMDNARLYAQEQHAVRARDSVLSVVTHDLRNPLGAILMSVAEFVDLPVERDRRVAARMAGESIRRAARAMNRLVGDLVDFASLERGRLGIDCAQVATSSLLTETFEVMRPLSMKAHVELVLEADGGDVTLWCDQQRIVQVLVNLASNALKFTRAGGTVRLRADVRAKEMVFTVRDCGAGIPASDLAHVFDRFWQAEETAHLGTGLGLSIAKAIVESHGGRIAVESAVGEGSTFTVALPLEGIRTPV